MPPTTKYTNLLFALLPQGPAWPRDEDTELFAFVDALGVELSRIEAKAAELIEEADPRTTDELLDDWERITGLPGDNPNPPTTDDDRRAALAEHLLGLGPPSKPNIEARIDAIGPTGWYSWKDWETFDPFVAGSPAGDSLTQSEWQYTRRLHLESYDYGGPIDLAVEWLLTRIFPAHGVLLIQWIAKDWIASGAVNNYAIDTNLRGTWVAVGVYGSGFNGNRYDLLDGAATIAIPITDTLRATCYDTFNFRWWVFGDGPGATAPAMRFSDDEGLTFPGSVTAFSYVGDLYCCAHNSNGTIVAAGTSGGIQVITANGASITKPTPAGSYSGIFYGAGFAGGLFVLVGTGGEIQTANEFSMSVWTQRAPGGYSGSLRDVHFGNGLWVAVGDSGEIQTSPDGLTWTRRTTTLFTSTAYSVTYAAHHWYTYNASKLWRTKDPTDPNSWEDITTTALARAMVWDGRYLATTRSGLQIS